MRKTRQAQPLSSLIGRIASRSFEARGLAAAGIAAEWPAIVGRSVAACSWPERLGRDGTLRVCVSGPVAVELQHLEPQILERIATYYGYRAVTRLAYVNRAPPPPRPRPPQSAGRRRRPTRSRPRVSKAPWSTPATAVSRRRLRTWGAPSSPARRESNSLTMRLY